MTGAGTNWEAGAKAEQEETRFVCAMHADERVHENGQE
jgi:hypothetical protein